MQPGVSLDDVKAPTAEFFERARARLNLDVPAALHDLTATSVRGDLDLDDELWEKAGVKATKPAAVLVPVVARAEPTVLLTVRTADLKSHSGQIAFPGGKDPNADTNPRMGPHSIERDHDGNMWITLALSGQMMKYDVKSGEFTITSSAPAPRPRGAYPHTLRVQADLTARGLTVHTLLAKGDPATELIRAAEGSGVDLIAMSTHGHRFLQDVFYGSTITAVRHRSQVPVLLVRAAEV